MITREDLNWWLELAPTLDWTFATTYAKTAPHEYVVDGRIEGMDLVASSAAASVGSAVSSRLSSNRTRARHDVQGESTT